MYSAVKELRRVIATGGILIIGVYSPNSFSARLKRTYDAINVDLLKRMVFCGAIILLWVKLRTQFKLSWQDARKRVSDLLDTPIVRYFSTEFYEQMGAHVGLKTVDLGQISNMNILYFKKQT
jgi:hypothetical protein